MLTRHRADADDLAQRAVLKGLEKRASYQDDGKLDRWLFRIAQRTWLNEVRARAVRRGQGLLCVEETDIPDESPGPEANIFLGEVLSAVMALPEQQRITLLLVYVEGQTYSEAASILEIPVGTVMSRLAAARKKLGQNFTKDHKDD